MLKQLLALCSLMAILTVNNVIANDAMAQASAGQVGMQRPSFGEMLGNMFPMIILVYFVFYFLVTRPKQQQQKQLLSLHSSLKKGDLVLTSSGIIARVSGIEPDHFLLDISNGVKVKFVKSHVLQKVELNKEPDNKKE